MAALCLSSASLPRIKPTNCTPFAITKSTVHLSNQSGRSWTSSRLRAAGLSEIEPDLNEDPVDIWRTPGIDPEAFGVRLPTTSEMLDLPPVFKESYRGFSSQPYSPGCTSIFLARYCSAGQHYLRRCS
ncbi:hypothetical protein LINGRAHAP2_LOCUS15551 [Linum grandiflorum]